MMWVDSAILAVPFGAEATRDAGRGKGKGPGNGSDNGEGSHESFI